MVPWYPTYRALVADALWMDAMVMWKSVLTYPPYHALTLEERTLLGIGGAAALTTALTGIKFAGEQLHGLYERYCQSLRSV